MVEAGMVLLIRECDVACYTDHRGQRRRLIAGLFNVKHKEVYDRLIIDRRPQIASEARLHWAKLPHGTLFAQIRIRPNQGLRGSGYDLESCFYQIKSQTNWGHRWFFGRVFTGDEIVEVGGDRGERYYLCLNVVARGDLNAVDIAQTVHEAVLVGGGFGMQMGYK